MENRGRRERKKAATRQLIADRAMELFLAHGFDAVSVKDVAEAADVAVTTLFKYFPSKEALAFDMDDEIERKLVRIITSRPPGMSITEAIRQSFLQSLDSDYDGPTVRAFRALVADTPALSDYSTLMWLRHTTTFGMAIATDQGLRPDDIASHALARFTLEANPLATEHANPREAINTIFTLIEQGWNNVPSANVQAQTDPKGAEYS